MAIGLVLCAVAVVWQQVRRQYLRSWQLSFEADQLVARRRDAAVALRYSSIRRIEIYHPRPLLTMLLLIARPERGRSDRERTFHTVLPLGADLRSNLRRIAWLTTEVLLLDEDGRFVLFPRAALSYEQARQLHAQLAGRRDLDEDLEARNLAWTSAEAGAAALASRDWAKAIHHYQIASSANQSLGHIDSVCICLAHLAECHLRLGQLTQAAGCAARALGLARNLRSGRQVAHTLNQLAEVGLRLGSVAELQRAVRYLGEAVAIHERLGERFFVVRMRANLALVHEKLFLSTRDDAELAACEQAARRALGELEQRLRIPDRFLYIHQKANVTGTLARSCFHRRQWREAAAQFQRAADVAQALAPGAQIFAEDQALWGRSLFMLGETHAAFERLCAAVAMSRDGGSFHDYVQARVARGDCLWDLNNIHGATLDYEAAIAMVEGSRTALDQLVERNHFMREWRHVFERTVEGLLQLAVNDPARRSDYRERAFRYTQLAKARSLSESMNLSDALLRCVDKDLRKRLEQAQRAVAEARAAIEYPSESAGIGGDGSGWSVLQAAEASHKGLIEQVARLHPELSALLSPGAFTAADVCRGLPRASTGNGPAAVLEFLLTQEALCVFLIGPHASAPLRCFRITGWGRARWAEEFDAVERAYDERNRRRADHRDVVSQLPDTVEHSWASLLPRVIDRLRDIFRTQCADGGDVVTAVHEAALDRLVLVPDGRMHRLPLHAALEAAADITYCPSCGVMLHAARSAFRTPRTALVVANPTHTPGEFTHPEFARELEIVSEELLRRRIEVNQLAGDAATPSAIVEALRAAELLHFAGHAVANLASPLDSHLKVAGRDARLGVRELIAAGAVRPGAWIVLNACETGLVSVDTSCEFLGLPGAFLAAGAGLVVSTLWPIQIEGPAELLQSAYARMHDNGVPFGRALRAAVDELRARVPACSAVDWAPYVIYGVDWGSDDLAGDRTDPSPVRVEAPLHVGRHLHRTALLDVQKAAHELIQAGRYRQAVAVLESFRGLHGSLEGPDDLLAQCYAALDMTEAELAIRRALVEQDPNNYRHHFNLGHISLELGDRAAACEEFRQTLALDPGHPRAKADLARWS